MHTGLMHPRVQSRWYRVKITRKKTLTELCPISRLFTLCNEEQITNIFSEGVEEGHIKFALYSRGFMMPIFCVEVGGLCHRRIIWASPR